MEFNRWGAVQLGRCTTLQYAHSMRKLSGHGYVWRGMRAVRMPISVSLAPLKLSEVMELSKRGPGNTMQIQLVRREHVSHAG